MKKIRAQRVLEFKYAFRGELWKYKGPAAWCFVTLPPALSKKIRKQHAISEEGWGRLKAFATIKKSSWNTAIWYDTKIGSYLLPVKLSVRKKEELEAGSLVSVTLKLKLEGPFLK